MSRHRTAAKLDHNVHFVDADNNEIGGLCQNGSLSWAELSEWMKIVYTLPLDKYAAFPCAENGDPEDPVGKHGASINIQGNTDLVQLGYYVLLSPEGSPITIPVSGEKPIPHITMQTPLVMDHSVSALPLIVF